MKLNGTNSLFIVWTVMIFSFYCNHYVASFLFKAGQFYNNKKDFPESAGKSFLCRY